MPTTSDPHRGGLRGQRGSAIVEFTLVSLLFFSLVFGLVEFGRALFAYSTIASAAREGVRYATVHGSESKQPATADNISAYVRTKAVGLNNVVVAVTWIPNNTPGSTVRVQVRYTFTSLLPRLLAFKTIPMSSTSFMVIVH